MDRAAVGGPLIGAFDPCAMRIASLTARERNEALTQPATRRLLVSSLAYYSDLTHHHFFSRPRGDAYTRIFLFLGGAGWIRMRGVLHRVSAGTVLVVPPLTPNFGQPGGSGWTMWWCDLVGTDVPEIMAGSGIDVENPIVRPADPQALAVLMQSILDAYEIDHSPTRLIDTVGAAWTLVTRLGTSRSVRERRSALDLAIEYIAHHLADEIRVPDVAAAVGLSTSRLQRIFRDAFGKGVLAHQIELRMERARQLLDTTRQTIAQVARQVGYPDPYYFSRHFRGVNGVSPTEYRRREPAPPPASADRDPVTGGVAAR